MKRWLVIGSQFMTLLLAAGLLGWLFVASWQNRYPLTTGAAVLSGVIILGLLGFIIGGTVWLSRHNTIWLVLSFVLLTVIKFPVVAWLKITPTADFKAYHALAVFNAHGLTWQKMLTKGVLGNFAALPHNLNLANFFSFSTALAGDNFFVSQLLNMGCTLFDLFLIYWIVARWLTRPLGICASLIFYCVPAYWLYSTLLNGAEPLFLTCLLMTMFALTRVVAPLATASPNDQHLNLILAWVATVVANMVRPIMFIWLIILAIFTVVIGLQSFKTVRHQAKRIILYFGATLAIFGASAGIYSWLYGFQVAPNHVGVAYSLATGTKPGDQDKGQAQIDRLVAHELKVSPTLVAAYPKITAKLQTQVQNNLRAIQGNELPFINQKMRRYVAADYGYNLVATNLSPARAQRTTKQTWKKLAPVIVTLSAGYFQLMILAALISVLWGLWLLRRPHVLNNYYFYAALLLNGFILGALPLEVQGNYHVILYLPLILLIVCGVPTVKLWFYKRSYSKRLGTNQ